MSGFRIGVDIGGTFTDFVLYDDAGRTAHTHKQLTTPADPSEAVVAGVITLIGKADLEPGAIDEVVHGTTLVTNAIIERKGEPTAMLVSRGFRDVLEIGMERRYDLFDLTIRFPAPVVPRRLRQEVAGRLRYDGSEIEPLSLEGVESFLTEAVERDSVRAVAICFLHAYANPDHERTAQGFVESRFPNLAVSVSSTVFPFMREYARWTTTSLNAYVQPVVDRYLARIEEGLADLGFAGRFLIMSSSGGTLTSRLARQFPIRLLESGPAAGALMAAQHGRTLGLDQLLSFDMGGTTAKGCIVQNGAPLKRYELEVARVHEFKPGSGLPAKIPVLDMIEIGAGGGSLAQIDERGVIRVGPRSAGAEPGPACYGRGGTNPTLTDANLLLGYLGASSFLGGKMRLDREAAERSVAEHVAAPLGLSVERAAWGIHEVINEDVARAFRVHASERGIDYRRCSMIVFGGSGPVHGVRVARKLRIPRVVCPIGAGVMSAFGLLASPLAFELVRSNRRSLDHISSDLLAAELDSLGAEVAEFLLGTGLKPDQIRHRFRLDMRYEGQGYEIEVPVPDGPDRPSVDHVRASFSEEYEKVFGIRFDARPIEIVNWKSEAEGPAPDSGVYRLRTPDGATPPTSRPAWDARSQSFIDHAVIARYALGPGDRVSGPALIEEHESTCVLGVGDELLVDDELNLIIEIRS